MKTDILIIGAGAAGLRAALAVHERNPALHVLIVGKGSGVSAEIMGFNAAVAAPDSPDVFYKDILEAGCGINDPELARTLADRSANEILFLEKIGVHLDHQPDGTQDVLGTLGATYKRLVHYKALTGREEMKAMRRKAEESEILFEDRIMITDLITDEGKILGAAGIRTDTGEFVGFRARAVILACGGGGAMHTIATYPRSHTGEGYTLALNAGAELIDMEFQQFEPCSFVWPEALHGQIVPTTLLKAGAFLRNGNNETFMERYGLTRDNARKGPLSRAIGQEIYEGRGTEHGGVYYDMTSMPEKLIREGHSIFYLPAKAAGLDITKEPAEMAPAAHTFLGGVKIDKNARTVVRGLYACGEAAGGIHGADRIGGNAGAEVLVFGRLAGESAAEDAKCFGEDFSDNERFDSLLESCREQYRKFQKSSGRIPAERILKELRKLADEKLGILREEKQLLEAELQIDRIAQEFEDARAVKKEDLSTLYVCRGVIPFLKMQIQSSLMRKESRGVFNRADYPGQNDTEWRKNIIFYLKNGKLICTVREAGQKTDS